MDNKTLLKVINGQQDKIESLEDKIDDLEAKNYQIKSDLDKLSNGDKTDDIVINRDDIKAISKLVNCESWEKIHEFF